MSQPIPREVSFTGVRVTLDSHKSFDDLAAALLDDVGDKPASLSDYVSTSADWDQYQEQIQSRVGPSGFMLFKLSDHTDWINIAGIHRKLLRAIIGNQLIAITMLRHDVKAGLFAPVELLLAEEDDNRSSLTYVKPSSLVVVETNQALLEAAQGLDVKLAALAAKVVRPD
jgi:uncharacterized protein (DUF302 family)